MTPPADRFSCTAINSPARDVAAPRIGAPISSRLMVRVHGASAAAGAAMSAMGRIVPTAGTSITMVRVIMTMTVPSAQAGFRPLARYPSGSKL